MEEVKGAIKDFIQWFVSELLIIHGFLQCL